MNDFVHKTNLDGSFGECLNYLLFLHGTRPEGTPTKFGKRWSQAKFAEAIGVSARTVRYWLDDEKTPSDLSTIERVLFGSHDRYDIWKLDLRKAARNGKASPPKKVEIPATILHPEIRSVPSFTGRDDLLAAIDRALWQQGGAAALTHAESTSTAIHGLGGVGKSVVAREYGYPARSGRR
jgi:hypothetical protein